MALEAAGREDAYVVVTIDGIPFEVPPYTTVAAAVVRRYGVLATRISATGQPRTMLCGMGICQECRMTVDGRAHVVACQTMCRDGMAIRTEGSPA
jgi:predicted molibdopterin-dependent oxidoreductase YjgC